MRLLTLFLGSALLLLLVSTTALGNGTASIDWHVLSAGGGHAEAGNYAVDGTIGQPVVGTAGDTNYELGGGFWCGPVLAVGREVFLPLVVKAYP